MSVLAILRQLPSTSDGIITSVVSIAQAPTQETLKHIQRIQTITIAWMSIEAALSLWAAWTARRPALAAFGGDSAVELMSAAVVLRRFRTHASEQAEQGSARIAGVLLLGLAVCVVLASAMSLFGYSEPKLSYLGMAVLAGSAIFLSQESSADVVREAFDSGAQGYVVKAHVGSELLAALEAVRQGRQFIGQGLS